MLRFHHKLERRETITTTQNVWQESGHRALTVTIKYGKGYEDTWAVFKGTPAEVRDDIIAYFGLDSASVSRLTLSDLVVNVTNLAHGKGNVAALMGGTVVASGTAEEVSDLTSPQTPGDDPWAAASQEASGGTENPHAWILGKIEACQTRDELKVLWAENQGAFAESSVMEAWKARGKSLTA